ncbi:VOC family protein [Kribbella solani]|uniref:Putative enzyme related to lactoylglutathione lyase n=1 Tax=Kribbella solani TaxID=236067 RepID=A0A841DYN3_9ACTN|nr:VOC family protein [Kribbella solani]MBB5983762.1 putative enzyme related to lactoylglutathione lyase [Kribbella solani]MDX3002998.1 VOC family protein [Kribbella solani]
MSVTLENIAVDCTDAQTLATFWAAVFSTEVDADGNQFFATVNRAAAGPTMMFLQVPEPRNGKNRLHLDLVASDWAAEVDRLVGLGAKRLDEHNEYGTHWITLTDPEGNVFDVAEQHG